MRFVQRGSRLLKRARLRAQLHGAQQAELLPRHAREQLLDALGGRKLHRRGHHALVGIGNGRQVAGLGVVPLALVQIQVGQRVEIVIDHKRFDIAHIHQSSRNSHLHLQPRLPIGRDRSSAKARQHPSEPASGRAVHTVRAALLRPPWSGFARHASDLRNQRATLRGCGERGASRPSNRPPPVCTSRAARSLRPPKAVQPCATLRGHTEKGIGRARRPLAPNARSHPLPHWVETL